MAISKFLNFWCFNKKYLYFRLKSDMFLNGKQSDTKALRDMEIFILPCWAVVL